LFARVWKVLLSSNLGLTKAVRWLSALSKAQGFCPNTLMSKTRLYIECPNCHTQYLVSGIALSYSNGAYIENVAGAPEMQRLLCPCRTQAPYKFKLSETMRLRVFADDDSERTHSCPRKRTSLTALAHKPIDPPNWLATVDSLCASGMTTISGYLGLARTCILAGLTTILSLRLAVHKHRVGERTSQNSC